MSRTIKYNGQTWTVEHVEATRNWFFVDEEGEDVFQFNAPEETADDRLLRECLRLYDLAFARGRMAGRQGLQHELRRLLGAEGG